METKRGGFSWGMRIAVGAVLVAVVAIVAPHMGAIFGAHPARASQLQIQGTLALSTAGPNSNFTSQNTGILSMPTFKVGTGEQYMLNLTGGPVSTSANICATTGSYTGCTPDGSTDSSGSWNATGTWGTSTQLGQWNEWLCFGSVSSCDSNIGTITNSIYFTMAAAPNGTIACPYFIGPLTESGAGEYLSPYFVPLPEQNFYGTVQPLNNLYYATNAAAVAMASCINQATGWGVKETTQNPAYALQAEETIQFSNGNSIPAGTLIANYINGGGIPPIGTITSPSQLPSFLEALYQEQYCVPINSPTCQIPYPSNPVTTPYLKVVSSASNPALGYLGQFMVADGQSFNATVQPFNLSTAPSAFKINIGGPSGQLPGSISMNTGTGAISGTITDVPGYYSTQIEAIAGSQTAFTNANIQINPTGSNDAPAMTLPFSTLSRTQLQAGYTIGLTGTGFDVVPGASTTNYQAQQTATSLPDALAGAGDWQGEAVNNSTGEVFDVTFAAPSSTNVYPPPKIDYSSAYLTVPDLPVGSYNLRLRDREDMYILSTNWPFSVTGDGATPPSGPLPMPQLNSNTITTGDLQSNFLIPNGAYNQTYNGAHLTFNMPSSFQEFCSNGLGCGPNTGILLFNSSGTLMSGYTAQWVERLFGMPSFGPDFSLSGNLPAGQYWLKLSGYYDAVPLTVINGPASINNGSSTNAAFYSCSNFPTSTPDAPSSFRYLQVGITGGQSWASWLEIQAYGQSMIPISPSQVTTVPSPGYQSGYAEGPSALVDGNLNTAWNAGQDNGTVTIDLGSVQPVSRIRLAAINSPDPSGAVNSVSVSNDGKTFTPLSSCISEGKTDHMWLQLDLPSSWSIYPLSATMPPLPSSTSGSAPVNGSCGPQNGETLNVAPTANLCSVGTASSVSGNGPWTWTCNGSNGGTNASCSANASSGGVDQVAGVCGSANGVAVSMAPAANLCSVGTATTVAGSGPWTWSCNGFDGGATASCNAGLLNGSTPLGQGVMVGLALSPFGSGWSSSITSAQPIPSGGISVSINPPTGFATQGKPYVLNTWCNATPSDYLGPPGADSTDLNTYQGPFVAVPSCTYAATGTYAMTVDLGVPTSTTSTFQWAEATYPITIGTPSSGGTPPPGSCSADDTACILQQLEAQVAALEAELQQLEAGQNGGTPPSASSTVSFPATINVTASSLNMRSSPQTGAPIVSVLNAGDTFTASGEVIGTNVEGDNLWWQTASTISASSSYVWSGGTVVTGQ